VVRPVHAPHAGHVGAIDVRAVGVAVVALGGGRTRPQDKVDPAVGFTALAGLGDEVGPDAPLGMVHARTEAAADAAAAALRNAYVVGEAPDDLPPAVLARFGAADDDAVPLDS
jgi:thymidine phosphorylase